MPDKDDKNMDAITGVLAEHKKHLQGMLDTLDKIGKTTGSVASKQKDYLGITKDLYVRQKGYLGGLSAYAKEFLASQAKSAASSKNLTKTLIDQAAQAQKLTDLNRKKGELEHQQMTQFDLLMRYKNPYLKGEYAKTVNELNEVKESIEEAKSSIGKSDTEGKGNFLTQWTTGAKSAVSHFKGMAQEGGKVHATLGMMEDGLEKIGSTALLDIPVLGEILLLGTAIYDVTTMTLKSYRDFNIAMIQSSAVPENRLRIFRETLNISQATGIAQDKIVSIMAEMVAQGQQFSSTFYDDAKTAVMLHEGLGLSVRASVELAANAHGTDESFLRVANTISDIQTRIGLSAEEAAKMTTELSRSFDLQAGLRRGPEEAAQIVKEFGPLLQGFSSIGRGDVGESLIRSISDINKNPGSYANIMLGGGVNEQTAPQLEKIILGISDKLEKIPRGTAGNIEKNAMLSTYGNIYGIDPQVISLAAAALRKNQQDEAGKTLDQRAQEAENKNIQDAFTNQISQSTSALTLLENSFKALAERVASNVLPVFTSLAKHAATWIHDFDVLTGGGGTGVAASNSDLVTGSYSYLTGTYNTKTSKPEDFATSEEASLKMFTPQDWWTPDDQADAKKRLTEEADLLGNLKTKVHTGAVPWYDMNIFDSPKSMPQDPILNKLLGEINNELAVVNKYSAKSDEAKTHEQALVEFKYNLNQTKAVAMADSQKRALEDHGKNLAKVITSASKTNAEAVNGHATTVSKASTSTLKGAMNDASMLRLKLNTDRVLLPVPTN